MLEAVSVFLLISMNTLSLLISMNTLSCPAFADRMPISGAHHDGIIFGASSLVHAEANLASCGGDPLPASVVEAYDQAWRVARPVSSSYFRGYGTAPGCSDKFLLQYQGFVPDSV